MKHRIFFLCPDNNIPSGGVKQIYRQVDILNENGFEAYIIHNRKNYRASWFQNETKIKRNRYLFKSVKYAGKTKLSAFRKKYNSCVLKYLKKISFNFKDTDYVVFPEIYGNLITQIQGPFKKVIFNQNCYYTFINSHINDTSLKQAYSNTQTEAVIVVSENSKEYFNLAFPEVKTYRTRLGINSNIFHNSGKKKRQIAFMPRKLKEDIEQIINILKIRNTIPDWEFVEIDNKNENEVTEILKESSIFLSFNHKEGFGLPPVEAMACGCVVIGYKGGSGEEYFKPEFSFSIEDGNIIEYVKKIEEIISYSDKELLTMGKKASEFVLKNYSIENEKNDIVSIWKEIIYN